MSATTAARANGALIAALPAAGAAVSQRLPETPALDLVDIAGREVSIPAGAVRLLIDDARTLVALALLHADPVGLLAGWPHDANRLGERTYAQFLSRFPALDELPRVSSSAEEFSLEQALAAEPTIALFSLGRGPHADDLRRLESIGIPVVFLDFFAQPLDNVDRSLEILGTLVDRADRARAFVALRTERRRRIADRLAASAAVAPKVLLEAHAGMSPECCNSPGRGNVGDYIELAGGHNIGADVLPGPAGRLSLEYVLDQDPEVYVATGGPHLERSGGMILGRGYSGDDARAALRRIVDRPGIRLLRAVGSNRAYGLSHQLLNSPLDVVALELLARWIHPDLFEDLDPAATVAAINRDFLAVPLEGTYWIGLDPTRTDTPTTRHHRGGFTVPKISPPERDPHGDTVTILRR